MTLQFGTQGVMMTILTLQHARKKYVSHGVHFLLDIPMFRQHFTWLNTSSCSSWPPCFLHLWVVPLLNVFQAWVQNCFVVQIRYVMKWSIWCSILQSHFHYSGSSAIASPIAKFSETQVQHIVQLLPQFPDTIVLLIMDGLASSK
jgi:hypothetical protein